MKYFLLKSEEQALATPGTYLDYMSISMPGKPTLVSPMFSITVKENGHTLDSTDIWDIDPWMIQQEVSPETHPEYFI